METTNVSVSPETAQLLQIKKHLIAVNNLFVEVVKSDSELEGDTKEQNEILFTFDGKFKPLEEYLDNFLINSLNESERKYII